MQSPYKYRVVAEDLRQHEKNSYREVRKEIYFSLKIHNSLKEYLHKSEDGANLEIVISNEFFTSKYAEKYIFF